MKVKKLKLLLALFVSLAYKSFAQPFPPRPRSIPPPVGDPVPIDSEIWILIVGALLLGLFFIRKKTKSPT
jgi:hypothetical protein